MQHIAVVGKEVNVMLGFRGELMKEMLAHGHKVYAFATDYNDESEAYIKSLGYIPVRYTLDGYSLNPLKELRSLWQLYRRFRKLSITVSYCYFAKPALYGTCAAWLARVPHRVAKIEGLGRPFTKHRHKACFRLRLAQRIERFLFKCVLPKAHELVLLNSDDRKDIESICGSRMPATVVLGGIGVCLERFAKSPAPINPLRFIFIGRLLNEKGIRYFLEAASELKRKYPKTEFWVLGEPDPLHGISRKELNAYIKTGIVEYFGRVENVCDYLHKSSVFVLPSYYREGLPRSSQEALAVGRAVITTASAGCRETVIDGANGYLVQPHDQAGLTQAMEKMIQDPEQVAAMGYASRRLAEEKFDVRKVNERMLKVLNL